MQTLENVVRAWALALTLAIAIHAGDPSVLSELHHIDTISSTVPGNGDVNPYGVAVVPVSTGALVANSILVSNFNNSANLQGTGITVVQISASGKLTLFSRIDAKSLPGACPGGVGLTTALVALRSGFVIVGSLPTADGSAGTAQAGCLIVLNSSGQVVSTISDHGINGPWDMTVWDMGTSAWLFVTNVLNGTVAAAGNVVAQGSVLRIGLSIPTGGLLTATSFTKIAGAFDERTDPNALVLGPTGLGLAADGTLYVADTINSRIAAIPHAVTTNTDAGEGTTVTQGRAVKQPLGLAIAPNGDIITVNGADGLMVETTADGQQNGVRFVDVSHSRNGAGTLFGLAIAASGHGIYFVDDGNNTLNILH